MLVYSVLVANIENSKDLEALEKKILININVKCISIDLSYMYIFINICIAFE